MHPYPKSFPAGDEISFLQLLLCTDSEFAGRWSNWRDTVNFDGINFSTIRLIPLLYLRLQKHGLQHEELFGRIQGIYKKTWVNNQRVVAVAEDIIRKCQAQDIPVLVLKGIPLVAEAYNDMGARLLGDSDILVHPEHANETVKIMLANGWKFDKPWEPEVRNPVLSMYKVMKSTTFINDHGVEIDIHWSIFDTGRFANAEAFREACWNDSVAITVGKTETRRLSNEDLLIHIIVHGSEGNIHKSTRWVTDAAAIIRTLVIDWEKITSRVKECGFSIEILLGLRFLRNEISITEIPEPVIAGLEKIPVSARHLKAYYKQADVPVSVRYSFYGNFPHVWRGYTQYESKRPFPHNILDFFPYARASWGLKSNREILLFIISKYNKRFQKKMDGSTTLQMLRDGFVTTSGRAFSFLASFAVFVVLGAFVPRDVIGAYNYIMATLAIISLTTLPGMNNALVRAVAKGYSGTLKAMIRTRLKSGLVGTALSVAMGLYFLLTGQTIIGFAFLVASPFVPLTDTFSNLAISYWQGKKRFVTSSATTIVYYTSLAILSILFILISDNLIILVAGILFAQAITGLAVYTKAHHDANDKEDSESISYGKHLTYMLIVRTISTNVDRIITWFMFGPIATAVYTFAATPVLKAFQLIPIGIVTLPHLSEQEFDEQTKKNTLRRMFHLFLFTLPATAILIILAPFIYKIFFPLYPDSVIHFQWLIAPIALCPMFLLKSALTANKKTLSLYIIDIAVPSIKIAGMLFFASQFGLIGIAYGSVVGFVTEFFLTTALFLREFRMKATR